MSENDLEQKNDMTIFAEEAEKIDKKHIEKMELDQNNVDQGLAKLVLTVIELLRKLMEEQAIRRIENGTVTDEQSEKMGETFLKLDEKMIELMEIFDLEPEDLNIDLGPLGSLF